MKILPWVRENSLPHVFDPYADLTQWTGEILVDCGRWQMPQKGSKLAIICGESYVKRSS